MTGSGWLFWSAAANQNNQPEPVIVGYCRQPRQPRQPSNQSQSFPTKQPEPVIVSANQDQPTRKLTPWVEKFFLFKKFTPWVGNFPNFLNKNFFENFKFSCGFIFQVKMTGTRTLHSALGVEFSKLKKIVLGPRLLLEYLTH